MGKIAGNQLNIDRSPTDLYPTDPHWTRCLLANYEFIGPIWEPAAGENHMVKVIEEVGHFCRATDILTGTDFLNQTEPWDGSIITNPPYGMLNEFVNTAIRLASKQVAMLLPIGGLGGQARYDQLWKPNPPAMVLIMVRRMVVLGKMSQFNHAWVVWDNTRSGSTLIRWAK